MNNLVKLNLFGEVAEFVGAKTWEFNVKSVQECIAAINSVTHNRFNEFFIKKNRLYAKYRILINGRDFNCPEQELNEKNWEKINQSELIMKKRDLETIDIVPFIESGNSQIAGIFNTIIGILLIVVGAILAITGNAWGYALIVAGITLFSSGVVALLSKPPVFTYNQNLDNAVSQSYLFNSPQNTVGEGGPVPIGYGTVLVGSNVVSAGYKVSQFQTTNRNNT